MTKKRDKVHSIRLSEKNKIYLKQLGFLDARGWSVKKDGPDLSRFVNECVTYVLESGKNSYSSSANPAELALAYYSHKLQQSGRENERVVNDMKRWNELKRQAEDNLLALKQELVYREC